MLGTDPDKLQYFYPGQHDRRWRLQENLAFQIAQAIDREQLRQIGRDDAAARWKLESEVAVAQEIQTSLIPNSRPNIPQLDVAAYWKAALQVSGDFYDFLSLPDDQWGIIIADVAGKGVPAALFMALSRTILRSVAFSHQSPSATLWRANEIILNDTDSEMFVTVFYALWNPTNSTLHWANGGHPPPILIRDGAITMLPGNGIALGVVYDIPYQSQALFLKPGDVVVFYTDGVTEATNAAHELFGTDRLHETLRTVKDDTPQAIVDTIVTAVDRHAAGTAQADDVTMVVMRVEGA